MKEKSKINVFIMLVLALALSAFSQEKQERLRLIHADLLKSETLDAQIRQILEGNVEFQQGKTIIKCDLAIQILNQDPAALIGHVQIFDEANSLFADTVYIYQNETKQIALGNVISISETDTTKAERITYFGKENKVISEDSVRIINIKENNILTGGYAEYFRNEKYARMFNNPIFTKFDSLGVETMTIHGDTMEFFESGKRMLVRGAVKIVQPGFNATCGQADYYRDQEKTILTQNPNVYQLNRNISGDTLRLYLEHSQIKRAEVIGNAVATSDADTLNKGLWVNKLTGQMMNFYFKDKKAEKILIENQATSQYHNIEDNEYKGMNEVSGDRIIILLKDGTIKRVKVRSNPEFSAGKYSPPKT